MIGREDECREAGDHRISLIFQASGDFLYILVSMKEPNASLFYYRVTQRLDEGDPGKMTHSSIVEGFSVPQCLYA